MKITPVLVVEEIEKSLPFWIDRMGFTKTVEVPDGARLGFVILAGDGAELMLQTVESVRKDAPQLAPTGRPGNASLFIERVTFYGMREIGVYEPGGHIVIFASRERNV